MDLVTESENEEAETREGILHVTFRPVLTVLVTLATEQGFSPLERVFTYFS